MNVLVIGGLGNMGRRYCSILRYLSHNPIVFDLGDKYSDAKFQLPLDHAIVATPTDLHQAAIDEFLQKAPPGMSVLCEKPVLKSVPLLWTLYRDFERHGSNLYAVNQYAHHPEYRMFEMGDGSEPSSYDYYHSGEDGVHWDCFQIYAIAKGEVKVRNKSPIWKCTINGFALTPGLMDRAYVDMVKDFVGPKANTWGREVVIKTTEKVLAAL